MVNAQPVPEVVPARMLNEFIYCPRMAWLEWVQGDFVDSADTVEGRCHHRRVDQPTGSLPAPEELTEGQERLHARSVHLSLTAAGPVARIDLVEVIGHGGDPDRRQAWRGARSPRGRLGARTRPAVCQVGRPYRPRTRHAIVV